MKIEIAGAGAGKTTSLSEKIIKRYNNKNDANIFCVSFTNSSVGIIKSKLEDHFGTIPENIKVATIHSFLNSQFINPYYFLLYGKHFGSIVSHQLDSNPVFARNTISRLESKNILHVNEITKKSKYLICGKSSDIKAIKQKRNIILDIIKSAYDSIFVDEAQDIDKFFSQVLVKLDESDIYIELIGDPKQDLKGNGVLNELLIKYKSEVSYVEGSHRCPTEHLNISNLYIPERQNQKSFNVKEGTVNFYFHSKISNMNRFISRGNYNLIYIYQKRAEFITSTVKTKNSFFDDTKQICSRILTEKGVSFDENEIVLMASKVCNLLIKNIEINKKTLQQSINHVFKSNRLDTKEYAILISGLEKEISSSRNEGVLVDSISKIKGKEGERCLFLVSNALMPYLLKETGSSSNSIKMQSHLYVGLTRSSKDLDLLFLEEVEKKYSSKKLQDLVDLFTKQTNSN